MNSLRSFSLLFPLGVLAVVVGCSGPLDGHGVLEQSVPVICAKQKECLGDLYEMAYPKNDCEDQVLSGAEKQYGDRLDAESVCSQADLDACLDAVKDAECSANGQIAVPCDC